jgi:hypothetical protein
VGQIGCINRDENAVNNIIKIVNHYLDKKERLLIKDKLLTKRTL